MGPTVGRNAADAASDGWLRPGLRSHCGPVTTTPVPCDLIRLVQHRQATGRVALRVPARSGDGKGIAPVRGVAMGLLLSGLFWAGLAAVAQIFWR